MADISKIDAWIKYSGINLVTGVHVIKSLYDGLGLEFNKDENQSEFESYREAQGDAYESEEEEEEKILVLVPNELVLSADRIRELAEDDSTLKSWLADGNLSDTDILHHGLLYLWLFKKENPWREYLDALPKHIDLPFTYSIKKMESLDFSAVSLHHAAITKRLDLEKSYERFKKKHPDLDLQDWLLPHAWISSRGLSHPVTSQTCLVPLIDMCNHSSGGQSNVRYDADEEGNFELLLTDVESSGELFLDYGSRSSGEFLFNYGFVPDANEDGFEELFKVFDPSVEEIRRVLDPSRQPGLSDDKKHEWEMTYDVLLEFFGVESLQVLRVIRFPNLVEPDESKRYRFHNNFIMALACNEHLELYQTNGPVQGLYLNGTQLTKENVFDVARKLGDEQVVRLAREFAGKLCEYFGNQVAGVSNKDDLEILKLAHAEATLYRGFANSLKSEAKD